MKINMFCPMCGKLNEMEVTAEQFSRVERYRNHEGFIQDLLPDLTASQREFIKTGYCFKCQDMLFGGFEEMM